MHVPHASRLGKKINILQPGECHASGEDEMIGTLLGSCVAVCLHDPVRRVSGMNHFMLPGRIVQADIFQDQSARYGVTAITELLRLMEKAGARREDLSAKVFGGGHVIVTAFDASTIPLDNVRLARLMLELEDIPIEEMEVGGSQARKILMDVQTGKVFRKHLVRGSAAQGLEEPGGSPLNERAAGVL
jgi:chemotaxis protein CheD